MQTINRETGEALDTVEIARVASLTGASTLADTTVMAAEASDGTAVFIVANAAGILASYQFGETNFFGWSR